MTTTKRKQADLERKQRMRQQLLDAAARVFIQNGYHRPLISDIAAEAGVGQGSFYRHFSDKRMIFEALLDGFAEELLNEFSDIQLNPADNFEQYRSISIDAILRMANKIDQKKELSVMFLREIPSIDRSFVEKLEGILDSFVQVARFHLDHVIACGFARPCQTDIVSHAMIGIALRLFGLWGNKRLNEMELEKMVTEACDFAFRGVAINEGINSHVKS
jgi:AcrR family transcriptional regulator